MMTSILSRKYWSRAEIYDTAVADPGHQGDPEEAGHGRPEGAARQVGHAGDAKLTEEEGKSVRPGNLGQVGHDDDVGDNNSPAPIQPVTGPNARVAQGKVVPQSGSARLSS